MAVQLIALIKVTDADILTEYKSVAGAALEKHGGRVVAGAPSPETLEASIEVPDIAALLEFPSIENARAWRADPDLADVHALRNTGGASTIIVLPSAA